ncbi:hypothetical protein NX059_011465 [Plenodomus lindquistii]|nr:hypothetical protein NX059_011465 [Plenodomus lindquistii]
MSNLVAIAGGTGNVAQEVIDAINARGRYKVVILSRRDAPASGTGSNEWRKVEYSSRDSVVAALNGIDTLLSFVASADVKAAFELQKTLVQAAISAGVRRFAPSEWSSSSNSGVAHYTYKDETRKFLETMNREKEQIEYCLFQPGFFTDYFAVPYSMAKHFHSFKMFADFEHRRAILQEGPDAPLTLTTVEDMAKVVAFALEYPGRWPTIGGIQGTQTTLSAFLSLGESIRGPFKIERLSPEDVAKGVIKSSWYPVIEHSGIPDEYRETMSKAVLGEYIRSLAAGGWSVGNEWNKMLPQVTLTSAEEYLNGVWKGK